MRQTTRQRLEALQDTPLILNHAEESFNSMSLKTDSNVNSPVENSKQLSHSGSGYNSGNRGSLSPKHNVFVLDVDGKPLTPTTNARARKLMRDKQAKPVWNKFSQFGIQMVVETNKVIPKTVLGVDFGTKFEGYSVLSGTENILNIMWKLPDKKKLVKKLEERRQLRRARRFRNCRRRERRFNNRSKKGFIAPSQLQIVNSRLKCISELFKCYPFDTVALEDVKFNHRDKHYGRNFSTVEIGKKMINDWIRQRACLQLFSGYNTESLRNVYNYHKASNKSAETFNSHCSDALAIATDLYAQEHIEQGRFIVVDDTYRAVRRRLHDSEFAKGGIRETYSAGNFKGIRKGTICKFGQIVGGTKNNVWIRDWSGKRIGRDIKKVDWFSKHFKTNGGWQFLPTLSDGVSLPC